MSRLARKVLNKNVTLQAIVIDNIGACHGNHVVLTDGHPECKTLYRRQSLYARLAVNGE
jgi:hypothetical protein